MVFEIKRSINGNLSYLNFAALTQTLLECEYCIQQYGLKRVIGCVTDVTSWHFLNCECQGEGGAQ